MRHSINEAPAPSPADRMAGLPRRLASLSYDLLLLTALVLVMTFPFVGFTGGQVSTYSRIALQIYLLLVCGAYFTWFWRHGGQTLPMKTWRIRLVSARPSSAQQTLPLGTAWLRYALAALGTLMFGITYLWAFFDKEKQFLHDRLAGTRIICVD